MKASIKALEKILNWYDDEFYYADDEGTSGNALPEWYKSPVEPVRAAHVEFQKLLPGLPELVKSGRDPGLAFPDLVNSLSILFQETAGRVPTTNSTEGVDNSIPGTPFQLFVRAVTLAYGLEMIDTLEDKVHQIRLKQRKKQAKTQSE